MRISDWSSDVCSSDLLLFREGEKGSVSGVGVDAQLASGAGTDGGPLLLRRKRAVQPVKGNAGHVADPLRRAFELGDAGEEGQHVALVFAQCLTDRARHPVLDPLARISAQIPVFQWECPAFALADGRARKSPRLNSSN